ncbi:MAG: hypothetical protein R2820_06200 [Cyclobacteriaceae bacterium]
MNSSIESIAGAQQEMRTNFANGSLGVLVSGLAWLVASCVAYSVGTTQAIWSLLIGGALIYPVSLLLTKAIGRSGGYSKGNILGGLAQEGTFFMLLAIPLAVVMSLQHHEWFFQGMLLIIGGRYLTFQTLYGRKYYWVLGALLAFTGFSLFFLKADAFASALSGSLIELGFGAYILRQWRNENRQY